MQSRQVHTRVARGLPVRRADQDTRTEVVGHRPAGDAAPCGALQRLDHGGRRRQVGVAGPAGEGPDVFIGASDWVGELATNGVLEPIEPGAWSSGKNVPDTRNRGVTTAEVM